MPTYVYECRECGKGFEVEQRITENALTDCDCGAKGGLRRIIQPVAVAFKGAGFHINDYSANKPASESEKPAETKTAEAPAPAASESTTTTTTS